MTILSHEKLREIFNEKRDAVLHGDDNLTLREGLSVLSKVVRNLRDAGFDIDMTVPPNPTRAAFAMHPENSTLGLAGIITLSGTEIYFGLSTAENRSPRNILALTWSDIRYENKQLPHSYKYNLDNTAAVAELQEDLIDRLAKLDAYRQIDAKAGNVLQGGKTRLDKRGLDM